MCKICADWQLGKLTTKEAWRNLGEMKDSPFSTDEEVDHYWKLANELAESIEDES